ncbi:hypothetical protein EJB05_36953, partial [Eragrostis curvula]
MLAEPPFQTLALPVADCPRTHEFTKYRKLQYTLFSLNDICTSKYTFVGSYYYASAQPIFNRDLRWCPTFSKLKTLLLNDWCVDINVRALACILDHSPVLEKLTLQLDMGFECKAEKEGTYDAVEKLPTISEHLNIVEMKCRVVDMRVWKILRFQLRVEATSSGLFGGSTDLLFCDSSRTQEKDEFFTAVGSRAPFLLYGSTAQPPRRQGTL